MTVERMVELLEIEKECVLRNATGECNRYCAGCDLLQDDSELHEMYTEAIALLKAQEPRVMAGAELTDAELIEEIRKAPIVLKPNVDAAPVVRCRDCKYYDHRCFTCENDVLLIKFDDCGCHPPFRVDDDWFCADGERRENDD